MKLKGIVTVQDIKPQTIDRNREAMRLFEKCINTNDLELGRKLIAGLDVLADTPEGTAILDGAMNLGNQR